MKDAHPIPRIDESLSKLGDAEFFTTLDLGVGLLAGTTKKQDRDKYGVCLRAGIVSMKEDAIRSIQRDSYNSGTDVTGTDKSHKEIWYIDNVLCGGRGDCDVNPERSYRAIGGSACMYEKGRVEMQVLEM